MSKKAAVFFSIWTSFICAIFNWLYGYLPLGGTGWVMFICLAVFFALGGTPKACISFELSAICGPLWGLFDFVLMAYVFAWAGPVMCGILSVTIGTFITMVLHINYLGNTPFGCLPFIFGGVALTFAKCALEGLAFPTVTAILQLEGTILIGIILCGICAFGQQIGMKHWPMENAGTESSK